MRWLHVLLEPAADKPEQATHQEVLYDLSDWDLEDLQVEGAEGLQHDLGVCNGHWTPTAGTCLYYKKTAIVWFLYLFSPVKYTANSPFSEIRIEKSYQIMWTYRTFIFPVSESLYPLNQCSIDTVSLRNDWGNYRKSTQLIINQTLKMMLKKRKAWLNSCCPVSDESSSTCLSVWHRREIQGVYIEWMSAWIAEKIDGIWS